MRRVHGHVVHSVELAFMDSTGNLDEMNSRFFLLCTHSPAGALPLTIFITSNEKKSTIKAALDLLKECLPENAFYNRGKDIGPLVIITDNCSSERVPLHSVWPKTTVLLCMFHVLKAIWKWLYDKKNNITMTDRQILLEEIKSVVYAETSEQLQEAYENLVNSETYEKI